MADAGGGISLAPGDPPHFFFARGATSMTGAPSKQRRPNVRAGRSLTFTKITASAAQKAATNDRRSMLSIRPPCAVTSMSSWPGTSIALAAASKTWLAFYRKFDLFLHQQGLDTTTPAGKAMFQMLGVFAEFERSIIQERVRAGLRRAKAEGKTLGRPPGWTRPLNSGSAPL
jgi:Resolvase, N terminal domain